MKKIKSRNAFTLIELLAVIVIIAIIAVITISIISDDLEDSRKNIAKDSAYGYKKAVSEYYYHQLMNKNNITLSGTYTIDENGYLTNSTIKHPIEFDGQKPKSGTLTYVDSELTSGCMVISKYAVTFTNGEVSNVEKGTCTEQKDKPQESTPQYKPNIKFDENETYIAEVYLDPTNLNTQCTETQAMAKSITGIKTGCMRWFVFKEDDETYTMILDHNTTTAVYWGDDLSEGPGNKQWTSYNDVLYALKQDTQGWTEELETPDDYNSTKSGGKETQNVSYNEYKARLISAEEIAEITNYAETNSTSFALSSSLFYFDTNTNSSDKGVSADNPSKYWWLFENLNDLYGESCTNYGCKNGQYIDALDTIGYWTSSPSTSTSNYGGGNYAWVIFYDGSLGLHNIEDPDNGVRPVIKISKSKLGIKN